jgi:tetratricopeptide (TPR) repeat protein
MRTLTKQLIGLLLSSAVVLPVYADSASLDKAILDIQHSWAHINYELEKDKKGNAFTALEKQAADLAAKNPDRAEPLVWEAIVLSTHAGVKGGLGALSMVSKTRELLEQAEKIDPHVLNGSIYTSLGSLYYQVPGWPLSFGSNDKAKKYLQKALSINPNGIDPNYFYGDFLYRTHQEKEALAALNKALQAPPRPNRPIADAGRRKEIRALIDKISNNG